MGRMKDYLILVSENMGFEGEINDEVIEEANERMAQMADFMRDERRDHGIHEAVTKYLKNHGNEDPSS